MEETIKIIPHDTTHPEACYLLHMTCKNCGDVHLRQLPRGKTWKSLAVRGKGLTCPHCECHVDDPSCFEVRGSPAARLALKQYKMDPEFEKLKEERTSLLKKNSELEKEPSRLKVLLEELGLQKAELELDRDRLKRRCEELLDEKLALEARLRELQ